MKIIKLEAIRGFVALYVVIHHFILFTQIYSLTPAFIKFFFRFGREAVLIFFLLSGFVICVSHQKNNTDSFPIYFRKRFLRIYPILLFTFFISILIFYLNGYQFSFVDFKSWIQNVFQLQRINDEPGWKIEPFLGNLPLWSLGYEWWFYMLFFPLIYLLNRFKIKARNNIYVVLLFSIISWILFIIHPSHVFLVLNFFLLWWAGFYCAQIFIEHRDFKLEDLFPVLISLFIMVLIIGLPIAKDFFIENRSIAQINKNFPITNYLYNYIEALILIITGFVWWKFNLFKFDLVLGWFKIFAPISYALFVIHFPVIQLKLPCIENIYLILILKSAIILLLSCFLEMIFQPWINKLHKKLNLYFISPNYVISNTKTNNIL
ncbi:acyltransferase family protein [Pedobacter rhodius]|uniref:Acyltransferase n=1 Tax=Pedobacter rhodius TaxID=3004098 RepID=A0ABT4KW42_9SPHI|nr:acyltransferase [Pedobacter sp. SJ11]MCZ4223000.1 acyltransferase [Pedobacter sp. SJ11]